MANKTPQLCLDVIHAAVLLWAIKSEVNSCIWIYVENHSTFLYSELSTNGPVLPQYEHSISHVTRLPVKHERVVV